MAHVKAGGKTKNNRNSPGQRLGIKLFAGQPAHAGQIIIRQAGTKWHAGDNAKVGKDCTIYAAVSGTVSYKKKQVKDFGGKLRERSFVSVVTV